MYQQAQIYVSTSALYSPYVGSTVLPDGPNPFTPDSDNTGLGVWLIVGLAVGGAALLILVIVMLLCCLQQKKDQEKALEIQEHFVVEAKEPEKPLMSVNDSINEWSQ